MTTHYEVESSPLLRGKCPLLAETASNIGDVQVRNMGTIGGSVAHADPAADYPAALLGAGSEGALVSAKAERTLAIDDFLVDTLTTALEPGEIRAGSDRAGGRRGARACLTRRWRSRPRDSRSWASRRAWRSGGRVTMARVGVTGLASKAYRAADVEKLLEGTAGSADDIRKAAAVVADGVDANSDLYASADYRSAHGAVYAARALTAALSRAS